MQEVKSCKKNQKKTDGARYISILLMLSVWGSFCLECDNTIVLEAWGFRFCYEVMTCLF